MINLEKYQKTLIETYSDAFRSRVNDLNTEQINIEMNVGKLDSYLDSFPTDFSKVGAYKDQIDEQIMDVGRKLNSLIVNLDTLDKELNAKVIEGQEQQKKETQRIYDSTQDVIEVSKVGWKDGIEKFEKQISRISTSLVEHKNLIEPQIIENFNSEVKSLNELKTAIQQKAQDVKLDFDPESSDVNEVAGSADLKIKEIEGNLRTLENSLKYLDTKLEGKILEEQLNAQLFEPSQELHSSEIKEEQNKQQQKQQVQEEPAQDRTFFDILNSNETFKGIRKGAEDLFGLTSGEDQFNESMKSINIKLQQIDTKLENLKRGAR